MKRIRSLAVLLLMTSCAPTPDDVKAEPIRFTMSVPAPVDRVGTCLASFYLGQSMDAHYLPVPSRNSAQLIVNFPAMGLAPPQGHFVFDLQGGAQTTVTFQRRKLMAGSESSEQQAKDQLTKCGAI